MWYSRTSKRCDERKLDLRLEQELTIIPRRRPINNMHNADTNSTQEASLQGCSLVLARVAWIVIVVPALALFVANIPAYFASLHQIAPPAERFQRHSAQ